MARRAPLGAWCLWLLPLLAGAQVTVGSMSLLVRLAAAPRAPVRLGARTRRWHVQALQPTDVMAAQDGFKLMIHRPDSETGVFSGDFTGPGQALAAGAKAAVASLHQAFKGTLVPLEVYNVNHTTLSPAQLCKYLRELNPGARPGASRAHPRRAPPRRWPCGARRAVWRTTGRPDDPRAPGAQT